MWETATHPLSIHLGLSGRACPCNQQRRLGVGEATRMLHPMTNHSHPEVKTCTQKELVQFEMRQDAIHSDPQVVHDTFKGFP